MTKSRSEWGAVLDLIRHRPYVSDLREVHINRLDEIETERAKYGLLTPPRPYWATRCRREAVGLYHWTVGDLAVLWAQRTGAPPDDQSQGAIAELVAFARTGQQVGAPLASSVVVLCRLVEVEPSHTLTSDWWLESPFPGFALQSDGLARDQMALEATRILMAAVLARVRLAAGLRVPTSWASALAGVPTAWGVQAIPSRETARHTTGAPADALLLEAHAVIRWLRSRGLSGLSLLRSPPTDSTGKP